MTRTELDEVKQKLGIAPPDMGTLVGKTCLVLLQGITVFMLKWFVIGVVIGLALKLVFGI